MSAYVSVNNGPSLKLEVISGCIFVEEIERRFLHHIVAVDKYYECATCRANAVMEEANNPQTIFIGKEVEFSGWFRKVFYIYEGQRSAGKRNTVPLP